jgi:hypothetical protein
MLQNWFGDRGEQIKKSWIKEWFVKGDYLYLQWTDKAPSYFQPDKPFDINWLNWKSHYFEFYDEGYLIDEIKENENG